MSTKDNFCTKNYNSNKTRSSANNEFMNVNLNVGNKTEELQPMQSKSNSISVTQNNKLIEVNEPQQKLNNSSKESSKCYDVSQMVEQLNLNQNDKNCGEQNGKLEKSAINNSTLSLHIIAYENAVEPPSNDLLQDEQIKTTPVNQKAREDPFSLPREQKDEEGQKEVTKFRSSDRVMNDRPPGHMPCFFQKEKETFFEWHSRVWSYLQDLSTHRNIKRVNTDSQHQPIMNFADLTQLAAKFPFPLCDISPLDSRPLMIMMNRSSYVQNIASNMASNEYSLEKAFASLPRTVRGLPLVISGDPSGTKFLYCNGNNVYIREIADPTKVEIYSEHAQLTTVAKYSPSGYYIASGDQSGKLRIWDTTQTTHILKAEYAFIAGPIRDIAWNDDSKRLAIVGEGRDRFGHVFLFDTGTSNGNLSGQSRVMTSIDFKPSRPYRLVSGSEDNTVAIFEGPPFKFKTLFHNHTRFVNCVRYNKDGSLFASAGADGKVFICDGVEGEKKGEFIDSSVKGGAAHAGGVFALAWNGDGSKIVSVSGDKTLKIWNAADQSLLKTVTFGNAIEDQQLAVTWQKDTIVSIGLSGFIFYINPDSGEITKTIRGHNKPITALALSADKKYAFTADFEGHITRWLISDGTSERLTPQIHKSQVASLAVTTKGTLVSIGWDDTVAFTAGVFDKVEDIHANTLRLTSQPRGLDVSPDGSVAVVVCQREIAIFKNEKPAGTVNIKYEAQCGAYQSDGKYLAVGGSDNKVHVYSIQDVNLTEKQALSHAGCITSVSFSNDGKYLVATDNNRKVIPYKVDDNFSVASEKDWTYHNARVNCGAWSPNGRYVATGGLDTNVIVWDIQHSGESPIEIRGAHSSSPINGVAWLDDKRLLTVGQDSNIKIWNVNLS